MTDEPSQIQRMSNATLWLAAIMTLGAILRLYKLTDQSIWYDEAATVYASHFVNAQFEVVQERVAMDVPLLAIVVHFWFAGLGALFGVHEGAAGSDLLLRLLPCTLGIVSIPLLFVTARRVLQDEQSSLIAAFLYAISPFHVFYAQEVRMYAILAPNLLAALWFFWVALDTNKARYWMGWTLAITVSCYNHPITLFYVATFNLFFLTSWLWKRRGLTSWLVSQIAFAILIIPALLIMRRMDAVLAQMPQSWYPKPTLKTVLITFKNFLAGYSGAPTHYWPVFLAGIVLLALGIAALRKRRIELLFLIMMMIAPVVTGLVVWQSKNITMYEHRLFIFSSIALILFVASGIRTVPGRYGAASLVLLVAVLTTPCLADHYAANWHPLPEHRLGVRVKADYRDAAAYVREHLEPGDVIGHTSHASIYPFRYYLATFPYTINQPHLAFTQWECADWLRFFPAKEHWDGTGITPQRLESVFPEAQRFWLVETWWEPEEVRPLALELTHWLDENAIRTRRQSFKAITVSLYEKKADTATVRTHQLADEGNQTLPYYTFTDAEKTETWQRAYAQTMQQALRSTGYVFDARFDIAGIVQGQAKFATESNPVSVSGDGRVALDRASFPLTVGHSASQLDLSCSLLTFDQAAGDGYLGLLGLETDDFCTSTVLIRNTVATPLRLRCDVLETIEAVDAFSFRPVIPTSDTWRPTIQYTGGGANPTFCHRYLLVSSLRGDSRPEDFSYAAISLPAGRYAVFVRWLEYGGDTNPGRASLRLAALAPGTSTDLDGQVIGEISSYRSDVQTVWRWRRVGELERSDASPLWLTVRPTNPEGLSQAECQIHRVALVPIEQGSGDEPQPMKHIEIDLAPGQTAPLQLSHRLEQWNEKRIDIDFEELSTGDVRHLYFYVRRADSTDSEMTSSRMAE